MTGAELIIYILENHLEEEPIVKDGKPIGFLTLEEAAARLDCGIASIQALVSMYKIEGETIGNQNYIYDKSVSNWIRKGGLNDIVN